MIIITPNIHIPEDELRYEFTRAGGPGGQHVNKSSTAVQLHFDVANSPSLPGDVKERLTKLAGKRMSDSGVLIINSREHRSQTRNRDTATQRLIALIRQATFKPKRRKKTKPSKAAKQRRLDAKKQRGATKRNRNGPIDY